MELANTYQRKLRKQYELTDHLGNVRTVITDRKLMSMEFGEEVLQPEVIAQNNYYPGGSLMPGRSFSDLQYRYGGAGGQESDEEISSNFGNHYTAKNWIYDSRLIRRWELDPMASSYPHQSPYSAFNNNSIYYIDPTGNEGEATVDKKNKTVTVNATFYYDKSNSKFKSQVITEDRTFTSGVFEGTTFKSEINKMKENGWEGQSGILIKDDDGNEWKVVYNINFVGLENAQAVSEAMENDPTANRLVFDDEMNAAGQWRFTSRTFAIGSSRRLDGDASTSIHEIGHSLSLPHSYKIPESPLFHNGLNAPNADDGSQTYGIMSYAQKREIKPFEVRLSVIKSINLANTVEDETVKIHIKGSFTKEPVILK